MWPNRILLGWKTRLEFILGEYLLFAKKGDERMFLSMYSYNYKMQGMMDMQFDFAKKVFNHWKKKDTDSLKWVV